MERKNLVRCLTNAFIPLAPTTEVILSNDHNIDKKMLVPIMAALDLLRLIPLALGINDLMNHEYLGFSLGLATYAIIGLLATK